MTESIPYWRLSGFYFFYFASLGALVPYWGPYLQTRGFDATRIGELMAVLMATKIVAPNVWGWIADHTGRRMQIVRIASLLSVLTFAGVFYVKGFWGLALVMAAFSFFWNASLPQFEAVTLDHLGERSERYSHVRLWGSIGFIASVAGLGATLDHYGMARVPQVVLVLYGGIWLVSLTVPERVDGVHPHDPGSLMGVLRQPRVLAFLGTCFLMQAGHGAYYAFYSLYLETYGYSNAMTGVLWALGVVAEVAAFVVMHRLMRRYSARQMLIASLGAAAVRWLLIALFAEWLWILVAAQVLHAVTFGVFHAAAIHLVQTYFQGRHQGRGQALYSSVSFGAGGAVGSLVSGHVWSGLSPAWTYGVSSAVALAALFTAWRWVDR